MSLIKPSNICRILVVDDLKDQREGFKMAIGKAIPNCHFIEAGNIAEAKAVLEKEVLPFDMAIIDVKLGSAPDNEDGKVIAQQIIGRNPQTAIIIVTAYPGTEAQWRDGESSREHAFISKLEPHLTAKLREKAKLMLRRDDIRENLKLQHKALEDASRVFQEKKKEWIEKYAGKFVLVIEGKIVDSRTDPSELWEVLCDYPSTQRCKASIIKVPFH